MADITITEGDTLEVDYSVENTGDGTGDQDVRLTVDNILEDTDANVVLDPGQTATGALQWPTESGDAVTDAIAEVLTDDDTDGITVTVEEASGIPDSEDLHARYDFSQYSGASGFSDITGNGYDLVNGSITGVGESINGVQAGEFNGSGDGVWSEPFSDIYPFTISVIGRLDSTATQFLSQHSIDNMLIEYDSTWSLNAASNLTSSNSDTGVVLITAVFADTGALLRLNGTQIASGSTGTGRAAEYHSLGSPEPSFSGFTFDGAIGEALIYPDIRTNQQISDIETYLADKWGVVI